MTIEYKIEPADFIAFSEEQSLFIPRMWAKIYYYGFMPILGVGLAVATSIMVAVIFTLIFLAAAWLVGILNKRAYRQYFYSEKSAPARICSWKTTVSIDGLQMASEVVDLLHHWPSIKRIFRNSRYIYFEITPLTLVHVPVRAFQDQEQLRQFCELAESYRKKTTS